MDAAGAAIAFRAVRIRRWSHLQETVEEGGANQVRNLEIWCPLMHDVSSQEVAGAVFKLFKQLPNLRQLRLSSLPFDSFNPVDSSAMQSTILLPHLRDLSIEYSPSPHSIIFDVLATSDHQISRLSVHSNFSLSAPPVTYRQLDFRGNLRFLSTGADFYRTLADPR